MGKNSSKIMDFIRKNSSKITDLVCFLGGAVLAVYNIFRFDSVDLAESFEDNPAHAAVYYYTRQDSALITVGIGLIVLGFLIRNWKKQGI